MADETFDKALQSSGRTNRFSDGRLSDFFPEELVRLIDSKSLRELGVYPVFESLKLVKMNPCGNEVLTQLIPPQPAVAKIYCTPPGGGSDLLGTAFLITSTVLLTAGHNLLRPGSGRVTKVVVALPAPPHFTALVHQASTKFAVSSGWQNGHDPNRDYGVIYLPTPVTANGTFPLEVVPPNQLFLQPASFAGYPDAQTKLFTNSGLFGGILGNQLAYSFSTCDGESGGPVCAVVNGKSVVVAVQTQLVSPAQGGIQAASCGPLLDPIMQAEINSWI